MKRHKPMKRTGFLKRGGFLKRTGRISPISKRRRKEVSAYGPAARAFLEAHPICQVWLAENGWREEKFAIGVYAETNPLGGVALCGSGDFLIRNFGAPPSTEVHHKNKRRGKMLLDQTHWLAVCRENHERIEQNKAWARANGFLENF